jgi:UDP-N-acetyl-D-glucosamine dehydrogenase
MDVLLKRFADRSAHIAVVGAGYVGLPFAVNACKAGFRTVAYDRAAEKIASLQQGHSYVGDVSDGVLAPLIESRRLSASSDPEVMRGADAVVICVPTPLNKTRDPDNSFIMDAAELLVPRMGSPQLVVLESTTFPGFTREVLLPKLASSGLRVDQDFFLAFSPERVDPGNATYHTQNTPKVVGGISAASLEVAQALYGCFIDRLVPVSSADAAEMVKLLENTFRAVNIGLVNEVAMMCARLGVDTWEVIEAAASKPFGFLPFYPGPGLGGHCIPIDPLYLSWKLKVLKYNARFIQLADEVNSSMPEFVVVKIADALNERRKAVRGSRILVCGVAYKRDIADLRESPALDIIDLLRRRGAHIDVHDAHVGPVVHDGAPVTNVSLERVEDYDCVAIVTDHSDVDYRVLVERAQLVVDARNATREVRRARGDKVVSI